MRQDQRTGKQLMLRRGQSRVPDNEPGSEVNDAHCRRAFEAREAFKNRTEEIKTGGRGSIGRRQAEAAKGCGQLLMFR